jgi:hypothetical protein
MVISRDGGRDSHYTGMYIGCQAEIEPSEWAQFIELQEEGVKEGIKFKSKEMVILR